MSGKNVNYNKIDRRAFLRLMAGGAYGLAGGSALLALAGCGGGGGKAGFTATGTGRVTMQVQWPPVTRVTRLIPQAANSIVIKITENNSVVATGVNTTIVRPQTTATINNVPVGKATITASAWTSKTGSGSKLATGSVPNVNIALNATTQAPAITMMSTVTKVSVSISAGQLAPGATLTATATAMDSSGTMVMVAPSTWKWTSSNPSVATVTGSGTNETAIVKGIAVGSATITASYTEPSPAVSGDISVAVGNSGGVGTYTTLHSFSGIDGDTPGALILDGQGNLFGVTTIGGTNDQGTIFMLAPGGTLTTLHSFNKNKDGCSLPNADLIMDGQGNIYGTTGNMMGDANIDGVVYKIASDGTLTTFHRFSGTDGAYPGGGQIMDGSGNLYGTTSGGGAYDQGTVYMLAPDGTLTTLHSFSGMDGTNPEGGLIMDGQGNIYGIASANVINNQLGTVFMLAPDGTLTTLYIFTGGGNGPYPSGGLIMDGQNNLYGTTSGGGAYQDGTVYMLSLDGTLTTLHSFSWTDGRNPGGLIMDGQGNLYGTTYDGGAHQCGTVYRLAPDETITTLYSFKGGTDGFWPTGVVMDGKGNLYGTTDSGGANGKGTIFEIQGAAVPLKGISMSRGAVYPYIRPNVKPVSNGK